MGGGDVITLDTSALDRLIADLASLQSDVGELANAARAGGELVRFDGRNYPPPPSGNAYVRTYVLRDGWSDVEVNTAPGRIEADIYNTVDYAEFVYGPNQAAIHSGRWPTDDALVDENEAEILALLEQGADAWLRGAGL
jgi:hypothetical protein